MAAIGAATPAPGDGVPVSVLRGAGVDVDGRRIGRLVLGALGTAVIVGALVVAFVGYQKNAQLNALHHHGVRVELTVTRCLGLMGGSGSNLVGYSCGGTYTFGGRRYQASIPGTADHAPGSVVRGVIDRDDPALFSTPTALGAEDASPRVFLLPGTLLACVAVAGGVVRLRRRRDGPGRHRLSHGGMTP